MSNFEITDYGSPLIVADKFDASAASVDTVQTVYLEIIADMMKIAAININSQGRRGGGSYARLKSDTVRKKGNSKILLTAGSNPKYDKLGNDTLFRSVSQLGAPYQIIKITKTGFSFGTERPFAFVQQYGSDKKNIPPRPFLRFLPTDVARWDQMLLAHLVRPFSR